MKSIHVAVGVIVRERQIFITRRLPHQHQAGKWEFPGGKVEVGESVCSALRRELHEELGIDCGATEPLLQVVHDYGSKQVLLDTHWVWQFQGEPMGQEGQQGCWVAVEQLAEFDFPPANLAILAAVQRHFEVN